jgi:hypothetical protein
MLGLEWDWLERESVGVLRLELVSANVELDRPSADRFKWTYVPDVDGMDTGECASSSEAINGGYHSCWVHFEGCLVTEYILRKYRYNS